MGWQGYLTLGLTGAMIVAMARNVAGPDMILVGGLTVLLACGVIDAEQAFTGFASPALMTVAVLFIVAAGIRETGALDAAAHRLLGRPKTLASAQLRLMAPVIAISAFLNNTPVVAMMMPLVADWARRNALAPSRLFIPLSYAAILGGVCTLIGTSTNLVVSGMADKRFPELEIGIFEISWLGIPVAFTGLLYVLVASRWLLPDRKEARRALDNPREYTVAMRVESDSPVVGRTIEEAGLRHLPGLFLVHIERDGHVMPAVEPTTRLHANDQLLFVGIVDSVVDLRKIRGISPDTDQLQKLAKHANRQMVEAVVAAKSMLVGKTVRETRFRTRYEAAIIAVHRQGERIQGKIGDIVLEPGDTLLLETQPRFLRRYRHDGNFALVSAVEGSTPRRHEKSWLALGIMVIMVAVNAAGLMDLVTVGLLAAAAMVLTRCLTGQEARQSLEIRVLIAIAAAFGIGAALEKSGVARVIAGAVVELAAPLGPIGVLAAIYVATAILTELITNNAAAALMFPIAVAAGEGANLPVRAVLYVLMFAASASFSTPIGYQTNLMVYGPGGYRFGDFLRFGLPLQLLLLVVVVTLTSFRWF